MRERGDMLVGILAVLLVLFPLGFIVHASPRFPGSLAGSLVGIAAALLMLLPLAYVAAKRIPAVDAWLRPRVSTPTLLAIHIYAGVLAPILGLIHAAHKFNSPLGVALTGVMLLIVITGFTGRYLLAQLARALRGRKSELASLKAAFGNLPIRVLHPPPAPQSPRGLLTRLFFTSHETPPPPATADPEALAGALADVEYAVRAESAVSRLFGKWRKVHVTVGTILYLLLVLHVWASLYYGLRWL